MTDPTLLKAWLDFISSLVWPGVSLILLITFRNQIEKLLERIKSGKMAGAEFNFAETAAKLNKDLSTQKDELNEQKQKLDGVTVFLFNTLINEAELRHLEGLASPDPYPLKKTGFTERELKHLRDSRLIEIPSGYGQLPEHIPDLREYAALTKTGRYYLQLRKTLKFDNVA